jgi:hypothetical protein
LPQFAPVRVGSAHAFPKQLLRSGVAELVAHADLAKDGEKDGRESEDQINEEAD